MKTFASDNTSGIHPRLLSAILEANQGHVPSYGMDPWTEKFENSVRRTFGPQAKAFLVFNGTAANVLSLSSVLRPFQSVICASESHLSVDECGAPERWTGSKLQLVPTKLGKLDLADVERCLIRGGDQHYSQPRVLSVAQPTELGTVYSLEELREIKRFCTRHNLILHMDGARLANAAFTLNCSLKQMTTDVGVDVLSMGGTKNGMMLGEAVIFLTDTLGNASDFKFIRKQGLQLASKQRFLAAPFIEYLDTDLHLDIAKHVCGLAKQLEQEVRKIPGVEVIAPVQSNGVFAKIPKAWNKPLRDKFFFYVWNEFENSVRWMTTWDHTEEDILSFAECIRSLAKQ